MQTLNPRQKECLDRLLAELIHQEEARVLVPPQQPATGFWFGGGNMVADESGVIWLCGRYRNFGDSRTGLAAGERGLECAIFRSDDRGETFTKALSWSKADLSHGETKVLSIEGTALHRRSDGAWELFVSTEKEAAYPAGLESYQKPGTGVWSIDVMTGRSINALDPTTLTPVLEDDVPPEYLHVKDPVVYDDIDGNTVLIFCTHSFSWSSGNTGLATRVAGNDAFELDNWEMVSRGAAWDVASTRATGHMSIPRIGAFADAPACSVYFYDGAECMRALDENPQANSRPRGYSCEELGGALFGWDDAFPETTRLSRLEPYFTSPWGTRSSRYVETLVTDRGILATWEQSQANKSQPLVGNFLPMGEVSRILSGG